MTTADSSDAPWSDPSPEELIGRLPPEVEYAFVKTIVFNAPVDPMTTLLLHPAAASDPMARTFREDPYGEILDAIEVQEAQIRGLTLVGDHSKQEPLKSLAGLRSFVYRSLLAEPALAEQGREFTVQMIPTGYDDDGPLYIWPSRLIQVWARPEREGEQPRLLDRRLLLGDVGPAGYNLAVADLLKTHCSLEELRRLRFCSTWWTRRDPDGWPVVTKYLIPRLYDYLLPYYRKRRWAGYTRKPRPEQVEFPRRLMDDIADILRMELRQLCKGLTWSQVYGAARQHARAAGPGRAKGKAMFRVASRREMFIHSKKGAPTIT